jgi:flagellar protein FlgJ
MITHQETREGALPIAPPSQIGLDVLRPPALPEIAAARAELARRPGATTAEFSVGDKGDATAPAGKPVTPESFKRFEAMVLQTFIQNMLPKDGAAVYGKGMAGDMWKAMLAERVATVVAERGGIGIADRMLGQHYTAEAKPGAEAAKADAAATAVNTKQPGGQFTVAPSVLDGMQRSLSELLTDDLGSSPEAAIQSITKRG